MGVLPEKDRLKRQGVVTGREECKCVSCVCQEGIKYVSVCAVCECFRCVDGCTTRESPSKQAAMMRTLK